jgi:hypothetical protein
MTSLVAEFPTGVTPVKLYLSLLVSVFTVAKFRIVFMWVMTLTFWWHVLLFPYSG